MDEIVVNEDSTLVLGDCLEYMQGMEAGKFDMILTDPPHGINFVSSRTKRKEKIQNIVTGNQSPNTNEIGRAHV